MHKRFVFVNTINHQGSSPPDVVDALICQLLHSRRFHDDIKAVRVILLQLVPLRLWVLPIKLDVFVPCVNILRDVHLNSLVGSNNYFRCTIQLEELGEDEACGSCAEEEDFDTDLGIQLVEAVDGAGGRLEKGRLLVGEVVDFVYLLLWAAVICIAVKFW
jgi:hypothetical protein